MKDRELTRATQRGASDDDLAALALSMSQGDGDLEREITYTAEQADALRSAMLGGFKRRCVYEAKALREKGARLSADETANAHRAAADAIKARHDRDSQQLAQTLLAQRRRQQSRILAALHARRHPNDPNPNPHVDDGEGGGGDVLDADLDEEAEGQLKEMHATFR